MPLKRDEGGVGKNQPIRAIAFTVRQIVTGLRLSPWPQLEQLLLPLEEVPTRPMSG